MHLIGFVIAGERVHDDVDAGAEREIALARFALDHRQHGLTVGPRRPGAGVNIVMYTLTGNYKADQVHVPALLERLGQ